MNKLWILVPLSLGLGALIYFALLYSGWLSTVTDGFNWLISLVPQVTAFFAGVNTFIKENPWMAPVLTVCGSLTAAGIVKWVSNRAQEKVVSTIQNQNLQEQTSLVQSYNRTIASVQQKNVELQGQLASAQEQLLKVPDVAEMQTLLLQTEARARSLADQVVMLQNQVRDLKVATVPVTVYK